MEVEMIDDTLTDGSDLRDVHSNYWYIYSPCSASASSPQGSYMYVTRCLMSLTPPSDKSPDRCTNVHA